MILAGTGHEALRRLAEAEPIDGVILDLMMPGLDGPETFRELRKIRPGIGVILTSGYDQQEVTSQLVGRGFADFIQKPFSLQELGEKTRNLLNGPPAR